MPFWMLRKPCMTLQSLPRSTPHGLRLSCTISTPLLLQVSCVRSLPFMTFPLCRSVDWHHLETFGNIVLGLQPHSVLPDRTSVQCNGIWTVTSTRSWRQHIMQAHLLCTGAAVLQALTTLHLTQLQRLKDLHLLGQTGTWAPVMPSCSSCAGAPSSWILPAQTCPSTLPAAPWLRPSSQDRCTSPPSLFHAPQTSGPERCC